MRSVRDFRKAFKPESGPWGEKGRDRRSNIKDEGESFFAPQHRSIHFK